MNEHELSEQLHAVAGSVHPRPDLAEIELGAGRLRGRRRVATGVVAAMLVAGAGGAGFGIGRSVSSDGERLSSAAPVDVVATTTPAGSDDPASDVLPSPPATTVVGNGDFGAGRVFGSAERAADDALAAADSYWIQEPMTLVYERMLDNGVRVRLQRGQSWGGEQWYGSDWQPALFCWATAEARLTIDGPDVVDIAGYGWYEELYNGLAVQAIETGQVDGHTMRVLQVQTAPGTTEVAVTWPDGATDRSAVIDGIAVLVVDGSNPYSEYTLEVTDGDGTRTMTSGDLDYQRDPDYRAACEEPPPALPDAGEQPADRAAAEAALLERFQTLWDRTVAEGEKPDDLLDDWTGVDEATAQIFEGVYAESAGSATHTVE